MLHSFNEILAADADLFGDVARDTPIVEQQLIKRINIIFLDSYNKSDYQRKLESK